MKQILAIGLLLSTSILFSQNDSFFESADAFFKKYVQDGKVDYEAVKSNSTEIKSLIDHIAVSSWTPEEEKAYLINVYNLGVIYKVTQEYPVQSPMDINNFFDEKDINLNGKKVSLNHIENKMLRPTYNDPRLHFSLVCGALGCPVIRSDAYLPSTLENQLEEQTKKALNNQFFIYQDSRQGATFLSEIFNWYKADFGGKDDSIFAYINSYREAPFNTELPIQHYDYDWTLNDMKLPDLKTPMTGPSKDTFNIQTFTAGSLLGKNKFDFTLFSTLYTENKSNWKGQTFTGFRATFVTHLFQVTYGISRSKRINIGLDFYLRNNGRSVDSTAKGIAPAFKFSNTDTTRFGLTSIGARVKVQPFKSVKNFSIQSTFIVPVIPNPEGFNDPMNPANNRMWGDWDRYTWWNQFFFDKTWGKLQLFTEVDLWFRLKKNSNQYSMLDIPMSVFFSYFPTKKMTIYAMTQHVPRLTYNIKQPVPDTDWVIPMNYTASGLGFKYNLAKGLNLELLYTNFWRGTNSGLGQTFNIGIKYITQ